MTITAPKFTGFPPMHEFSRRLVNIAGQMYWALVHDKTGRRVAGSSEKKSVGELYYGWIESQKEEAQRAYIAGEMDYSTAASINPELIPF